MVCGHHETYTVRKPNIQIFKRKKNQSKIIFRCWDISILVEQIRKKWRKTAIAFGAIMVRAFWLALRYFPAWAVVYGI